MCFFKKRTDDGVSTLEEPGNYQIFYEKHTNFKIKVKQKERKKESLLFLAYGRFFRRIIVATPTRSIAMIIPMTAGIK